MAGNPETRVPNGLLPGPVAIEEGGSESDWLGTAFLPLRAFF